MLFRGFILAAALGASSPLASAFVPQTISSGGSTSTSLCATVDPSVVTKKEYQDICGVDFDDQTLEERLTRTKFLYPKHVEVIEDLAPIAGAMVDDVVSSMLAGADGAETACTSQPMIFCFCSSVLCLRATRIYCCFELVTCLFNVCSHRPRKNSR